MSITPRLYSYVVRRALSQVAGGSKPTTSAASGASAGVNANVPGLSSKCVKPTTEPVGPGAATNSAYKVPEYFCFNRFSYTEAELEMAKYRCPQPNANVK